MSEVFIGNGGTIPGSPSIKETLPAERSHIIAERQVTSGSRREERLNSALDVLATTRLAIEDRDGQYIYKIYDPVTGEVLQQIPNERLLRQREALAQSAAVLLGVKV